jgi:hypothetical protein
VRVKKNHFSSYVSRKRSPHIFRKGETLENKRHSHVRSEGIGAIILVLVGTINAKKFAVRWQVGVVLAVQPDQTYGIKIFDV